MLVPFSVSHDTESIFCTRSRLLPVCPFFLPYRVKHFGPVYVPFIFMYLLPFAHLMHRYLLAFADHSVRCPVSCPFFSTKLNWSFGFGLSSSQSFHCSTQQWKLAAYCKAAYTSSLSCWKVSALASAINPPSNKARYLHQIVGLFFVLCDKLLKMRHLFLVLLCAVRGALTCSTSTCVSFDVTSCNSSQILSPQVRISPAFGSISLPFSSPKAINNSFVVDMHLDGSITFLRRQGRPSAPPS